MFDDPARFLTAANGRRFGKSYVSVYKLIAEALKNVGIYYFISPSYSMSKTIIWEILKEKCEGFTRKTNESELTVFLSNGSKIALKSADNINALRGASLSGCIIDEAATIRELEDLFIKVVRPMVSDREGFVWFTGSPNGRGYFYELYLKGLEDNPLWSSHTYTTLQGGRVSEEEVLAAKEDMDERSFRSEFEASFESYEGLVVPEYDIVLSKSEEVVKPSDTLIIGIDFNIGKQATAVFIKRNNALHMVDAFFGSYNTEDLMQSIQYRYPDNMKIFHTDASGTQRNTASDTTNVKIIESYKNPDGSFYKCYNLKKNPRIISRVNAFNSLVYSATGVRKVFFVKNKRTKNFIDTLLRHSFDANGMPFKKNTEFYSDCYDAMSYAVWPYSSFGNVKPITSGRR